MGKDQILYNEDEDVCIINTDGSGKIKLTDDRKDDISAVWSPDGRKIAFCSEVSYRNWEICVMNADGTDLTNLTLNSAGDKKPVWSPDGNRIAFISDRGSSNKEVFLMNADGTNLVSLGCSASYFEWSPDGKQIIFIDSPGANYQLNIVNADGSRKKSINLGFQPCEAPGSGKRFFDISPTGDKMLFVYQSTIYSVNMDGTNLKTLSSVGSGDYDPVWSPDGKKIVFVSTSGFGDTDISIMNADGTGKRKLTKNENDDTSPSWSADGSKILWCNNSQIYSMNSDGTGQRKIVTDGVSSDPIWKPLGGNGTSTDDTLNGGSSKDILFGFDGNDSLNGQAGDDYIDGGSGEDHIDGGVGKDSLYGGDGNDTIVYDAKDILVNGGAGMDTLDASSQKSAVVIDLMQSKYIEIETVLGGVGNDKMMGDNNSNVLNGGAGNDILNGNGGADTLLGGDGSDQLDGGIGDDVLSGGAGADKYLFGLGSGNDVILADASNAEDTVVFGKGITLSSLDFVQEGSDLRINNKGNVADSLTIQGWFDNAQNQIGKFQFADGSVYGYRQGAVGDDNLIGTTGKDIMYGNGGNDTLNGQAGDDYIDGGAGEDRLDGGVGKDSLYGGDGNDSIVYDAKDILVNGGAGMDTLDASSQKSAVVIDLMQSKYIEIETVLGGVGNDKMMGDNNSNVLNGGAGNDILNGNGGADTLLGGDGSDQLDGGIGDDVLTGGAGADKYLFGLGSGNDVILADASNAEDTVVFGKGITLSSLDFVQEGSDLRINNKGNVADSLTIQGWFDNAQNQIGKFQFADGSVYGYRQGAVGDDNLIGTTGKDIMYGNGGNDTLNGQAGDDYIDGGAGEDRLDGGVGKDSIYGGDGNDIIVYDATDILVNGGAGMDTLDASSLLKAVTIDLGTNNKLKDIENVAGGKGSDKLVGNAGDNTLFGNEGNDTLDGGKGNDILWGGTGSDKMIGGAGDDIFVVDNTGDVVIELADEGTDTVQASITYTLGVNVENLTLTGTGDINATGNGSNNIIIGNSGSNILDGGAGNDYLRGGLGDDTYLYGVGSGNDTIDSYEGDSNGFDTIQLGQGITIDSFDYQQVGSDLILRLKNGGNTLTLKDWFIGDKYQVDIMKFADGTEITAADAASMRVITTFTGSEGNNTLTGLDTCDKIYGLGGDDFLYGNGGKDWLFGGAGDDTLDGGTGADIMNGGEGDDIYVVDNIGDKVLESVGAGYDTVVASISYTLGNYVESLVLNGSSNIDGIGNKLNNLIVGNSGDNKLYGGEGDDWLDGGAGADYMEGGKDNDRYVVDDLGDKIIELTDQGYDRVYTSIDYTLPDNVEVGIVQSNIAVHLRGNSGDNSLIGSNGSEWFDGGAGNDYLWGGEKGIDTFHFQGDFGNDYIGFSESNYLDIIEFEGVKSTDAIFIDNNFKERIIKIGNNSVTYCYSDGRNAFYTNHINIFKFDDGVYSIQRGDNYKYSWVKLNVTFGTDGADSLIGTGNHDILYGLQGDDTIKGGGGDNLFGGSGNDTYLVDFGDRVVEMDGEGIDTVISSVSYSLGDNIENLTLTGGVDDDNSGQGNKLNNIIIGNSGRNRLDGGDGNDIIDGGAGEDIIAGGAGNDTIIYDPLDASYNVSGGDGIDTLDASRSNTGVVISLGTKFFDFENIIGGKGDDMLYGGSGENILIGGYGNDILDGDAGDDILCGGSGNDLYLYGVSCGNDIIYNYEDGSDNGTDTIQFQNLALNSVAFTKDNNDLVCTITQTGESIRIPDWTLGENYYVDQFQFANGMLTATQVNMKIA